MAKTGKDDEREERLNMEIIVDAYGEEEHAMGWYYYLADKIVFPFRARVIKELKISPLKKGEIINVIEMADEEDCLNTMYVQIEWKGRKFGVPLEQLIPVETECDFYEDIVEAIEDWNYWIDRGYRF
jgi:hypothetical protein